MPSELREVDVHLISLVDKGANKRTLIWKSALTPDPSPKGRGEMDQPLFNTVIRKIDDEKKLIYCIVYAPDDIDTHEDYMTADTVEKAAHGFMAKSNTKNAVDTNHNLEICDGVTIVESAINKGHKYFPDEKDKDAWYIAAKIENEEIWKGVKDGTYTGVSLYGFAKRIEKSVTKGDFGNEGEDSIGLMKHIKKFFNVTKEDFSNESVEEIRKTFEETYSKMTFRTIADALSSAIWDVLYNDMLSLEEKRDGVIEVMDKAKQKWAEVEIAKSEIMKAGKTISSSNLKKLQAAMNAIQELIDAADKSTEKSFKKINKTEMENTEITKEKYDADIAAKDAEVTTLKAEVEELKKLSKGSTQVKSEEPEKKEEVKKCYSWLS